MVLLFQRTFFRILEYCLLLEFCLWPLVTSMLLYILEVNYNPLLTIVNRQTIVLAQLVWQTIHQSDVFVSYTGFLNLTNLEELFLDDSPLPIKFLQSIGVFSAIKVLSMSNCQLNGTLLTSGTIQFPLHTITVINRIKNMFHYCSLTWSCICYRLVWIEKARTVRSL
jgi:hypothetical protein